jgi:hypothetical protein
MEDVASLGTPPRTRENLSYRQVRLLIEWIEDGQSMACSERDFATHLSEFPSCNRKKLLADRSMDSHLSRVRPVLVLHVAQEFATD